MTEDLRDPSGPSVCCLLKRHQKCLSGMVTVKKPPFVKEGIWLEKGAVCQITQELDGNSTGLMK